MRCWSPLALLVVLSAQGWLPPSLCAGGSPNRRVELRFAGYPSLECADSRYPEGRNYQLLLRVVVLVVGADDRIRRSFGCSFVGDASLLHAMATEHDLHFINLSSDRMGLVIRDADCVVPRRGLPSEVFDLQMNVLGAADHAPAGCLMHRPTSAAVASKGVPAATATVDTAAPGDGGLLIRFQRVSFPALECRLHEDGRSHVTLQGLVQPPDDHFSCRFRYPTTGVVVGAMLRYLSAAYGLALDTHAAGLPVLKLRPFACAAGATDDADVDFRVTGPSGRTAGCNLSPL